MKGNAKPVVLFAPFSSRGERIDAWLGDGESRVDTPGDAMAFPSKSAARRFMDRSIHYFEIQEVK